MIVAGDEGDSGTFAISDHGKTAELKAALMYGQLQVARSLLKDELVVENLDCDVIQICISFCKPKMLALVLRIPRIRNSFSLSDCSLWKRNHVEKTFVCMYRKTLLSSAICVSICICREDFWKEIAGLAFGNDLILDWPPERSFARSKQLLTSLLIS